MAGERNGGGKQEHDEDCEHGLVSPGRAVLAGWMGLPGAQPRGKLGILAIQCGRDVGQ